MANVVKIRGLIVVVIVNAIIALAVWIDTAPYREALDSFVEAMPVSVVEDNRSELGEDVARYLECSNRREQNGVSKDLEYTASGRTCLMDALVGVKTGTGALILSVEASKWLLKNPDDSAVREAAITSIQKGRDELVAKKHQYDSLEKVALAHDRSILLRLVNGPYGGPSTFRDSAERLNKAEYSVLMPEVALKQNKWLLEAATSKQ